MKGKQIVGGVCALAPDEVRGICTEEEGVLLGVYRMRTGVGFVAGTRLRWYMSQCGHELHVQVPCTSGEDGKAIYCYCYDVHADESRKEMKGGK